MLEGKIKNRNGKLYVLYSTTEYGQPIRQYMWWRVVRSTANQYNANVPSDGDTATSRGGGQWSTYGSNGLSGGVSTGDGSTPAELIEKVSVEPPPARGKELRWKDGQWEKLMAIGWAPAGEGSTSPKPKAPRKKTGAQLDREIADELEKRR
jgi:hypothetical protein